MNDTLDRRLTTRVLNIWKRHSKSGFPRRSQVDPRDFGTDWSNCLMIDLDPDLSKSRFSYVGRGLQDPTWPTFDRQMVAECLSGTLLELLNLPVRQHANPLGRDLLVQSARLAPAARMRAS